jgi:hypothetical protein
VAVEHVEQLVLGEHQEVLLIRQDPALDAAAPDLAAAELHAQRRLLVRPAFVVADRAEPLDPRVDQPDRFGLQVAGDPGAADVVDDVLESGVAAGGQLLLELVR